MPEYYVNRSGYVIIRSDLGYSKLSIDSAPYDYLPHGYHRAERDPIALNTTVYTTKRGQIVAIYYGEGYYEYLVFDTSNRYWWYREEEIKAIVCL
jgi:hypothetical protein